MSVAYLGRGHTGHKRHSPTENKFHYPLFLLKFRVDEEEKLQKHLHAHFRGLLSLKPEDYLGKDCKSFAEAIRNFLQKKCGGYEASEIWLVTMPHVFGFAFNPVSFWFCYREGRLDRALCEVNNTFGERHYYWVKNPAEGENGGWVEGEKHFHVSPFLPVEGKYRFRFQDSDSATRVDINYFNAKGDLQLSTWVEAKCRPIKEETKTKILFTYGWLTALVVARIHFQALKLWLKGIRFFPKPAPPKQEVTQ